MGGVEVGVLGAAGNDVEAGGAFGEVVGRGDGVEADGILELNGRAGG